MEEEAQQEPYMCSKCMIRFKGEVAYLDSFPPGYKFEPTDEELILFYLKAKVKKECLPCCKMDEVNLYEFSPEDLTKRYDPCEENDWYFFTSRDRKYKNGNRPNRAADGGYWKITGKEKKLKDKGITVGSKNNLVFYTGKYPNGTKTNWIMYEYRLNGSPLPKGAGGNGMMLDEYVLCRIHWKKEIQDDGTNNDQANKEGEAQDMTVQLPTNHQTALPSVHPNNIVRNNQNLERGTNVGIATSDYQNPNTTFRSSMTFLREEVQQFNNHTRPMGMDSGYNYLGHELTNCFNNPIQYPHPLGPIRNSCQYGPPPLSGYVPPNPNGMWASGSQPPPNLNRMLPYARQAPPSFRPMGMDRTSDYNHLIGNPNRYINHPIHPPEGPTKNLSQYGPPPLSAFNPPNPKGMWASGSQPPPNLKGMLPSARQDPPSFRPMGMNRTSGYNHLIGKPNQYINHLIHPPEGPTKNLTQYGPLPLSGFNPPNPNGMGASGSQPPPNLNGMLPSARQAPPSFCPMEIDRTSDYNHLIGKLTRYINHPIHPPEGPIKNLSHYGPRAPPSFDSGPFPGFDLPNINGMLGSRPPVPSGFDRPNPHMMFARGHPDPRMVSVANTVLEHLTKIPSTTLSREGPSLRYSSGSDAMQTRTQGEMENHQGSNQDQTNVHDQSSGSEMDHQHSNSECSSS